MKARKPPAPRDRELAETMAMVTVTTLSEPEIEMLAIYRLTTPDIRGALVTIVRSIREREIEKGGA